MEYMKKRIDVAKIISNLISAPICFGQKRKIVRKKIYRLLSKEHISDSNKEEIIANEIENKYLSIVDSIRYGSSDEKNQPKIVWQYWAQGDKCLPKIVKICMNTVYYHFKQAGYQVICLNDESVNKYLNIDEHFLQMASLNRHGYSYASYSDLLRCGLLYKYGGIWIDATVLISNVPYELLNNERVFFERSGEVGKLDRLKYRLYSDYFRWGAGVRVNWLSSIIKAPKGDPLFGMLWDILNKYWLNEQFYRHYFLCHIIFDQIKNRGNLLKNYKYISISDTFPHDLQMLLSSDINKVKLKVDNILRYPIHKLTYKIDDSALLDRDSVFNYLINKYKN